MISDSITYSVKYYVNDISSDEKSCHIQIAKTTMNEDQNIQLVKDVVQSCYPAPDFIVFEKIERV